MEKLEKKVLVHININSSLYYLYNFIKHTNDIRLNNI